MNGISSLGNRAYSFTVTTFNKDLLEARFSVAKNDDQPALSAKDIAAMVRALEESLGIENRNRFDWEEDEGDSGGSPVKAKRRTLADDIKESDNNRNFTLGGMGRKRETAADRLLYGSDKVEEQREVLDRMLEALSDDNGDDTTKATRKRRKLDIENDGDNAPDLGEKIDIATRLALKYDPPKSDKVEQFIPANYRLTFSLDGEYDDTAEARRVALAPDTSIYMGGGAASGAWRVDMSV